MAVLLLAGGRHSSEDGQTRFGFNRPDLDHANISTSSRYLKSSKLALHTTMQRIDAQRRQNGEAAKWEADLAELQKNLQREPQKEPHADKIGPSTKGQKSGNPSNSNPLGA